MTGEKQMDHRLLKYMQSVQEYEKALDTLSEKWNLLTMLGKMSNTGMDMIDTRAAFEALTAELLDKLGLEILKKTTSEMEAKAQVAVDIVIRNLFERTADIGFLATDDDIRSFLRQYLAGTTDDASRQSLRDRRMSLKNRFKEYVSKYSVYSNIILMDTRGNIVAQLDDHNPITGSSDPLIKESLSTSAEYVEVFRKTDLVPNADKALIYSYRVKSSSSDDAESIGVLSLIFRFEDEMVPLSKIIAQAMKAEQAAHDFYLQLADRFGSDVEKKNLLLYFSMMEMGHYKLLDLEKSNLERLEEFSQEQELIHLGP